MLKVDNENEIQGNKITIAKLIIDLDQTTFIIVEVDLIRASLN